MAWLIVAADAAWVALSVALDFPSRLEVIFQILLAALTLAMVFVIQHTQTREQLVTQRKLDEILRALPGADNALIALEEASDTRLHEVHESHIDLRGEATRDA